MVSVLLVKCKSRKDFPGSEHAAVQGHVRRVSCCYKWHSHSSISLGSLFKRRIMQPKRTTTASYLGHVWQDLNLQENGLIALIRKCC